MTVTSNDIRQYQARKHQLQAIDDEIEWTYGKVSSPNGHRSGGSSSPGDPTATKVRRVEALNERRQKILAKQKEVEDYVDALEDVEVSNIIRYRYIIGWTWENVAIRMRGSPNYQQLHRKVRRHFRDMKVTE